MEYGWLNNAWFIGSLALLFVWAVIYFSLKSKETKKEMWIVSLWTSPLGLLAPFFVPEYWNPPSLFDLAARTGFDIESLLFSFAIGGIVFVMYEIITGTKHQKINKHENQHKRHSFHFWAIASAPISFVVLEIATNMNAIYTTTLALVVGFFATLYCRPDLLKKMLISGILFLFVYFAVFYSLLFVFPEFIDVWNISALSGITIFSIPIEEFEWAFAFGLYWSSVFEHFGRYKIVKK